MAYGQNVPSCDPLCLIVVFWLKSQSDESDGKDVHIH